MLLVFTLSLNAWLLSVLVLRVAVPCFQVPWSVLLTLFAVSLLVSVLVHMQRWRCWKYLRHGPQRLRSFHEDHRTTVPYKHVAVCWCWWMVGTALGITYMCEAESWPWALFAVLPAGAYTAATASVKCVSSPSDTPSDDSSPESPNVNAEDLDSLGELGSSVAAVN